MAYQLELPLFFDEEHYEDNALEKGPCLDDVIEWTDEDIDMLRAFVFEKTLYPLQDSRASLAARTDSVEWLMDDSMHPFSYIVCCGVMGVDPYEFRELVVRSIKQK